MDIFPGHNYSSITAHERLPVVPDIDEDEDAVDEGECSDNCGDENSSHVLEYCQATVSSVKDVGYCPTDRANVHVSDEVSRSTGNLDSTANGLQMTLLITSNHHDIVNDGNICPSAGNVINNIDKTIINKSDTAFSPTPFPKKMMITDIQFAVLRKAVKPSSSMERDDSMAPDSHQLTWSAAEDAMDLLPRVELPRQSDRSRNSSVTSRASSTGSIGGLSASSSVPDFRILKSAMKRSCEEDRTEKRRLSLFNQVMRRVSIHRRDSTPTGRIATFLFGLEDPAMELKEQNKDWTRKGEMLDHKDVEENGGHGTHNYNQDRKAAHGSQLRESLFLILSGLYGIIVVILGAVIPITEIFMVDTLDRAFEAFYVYLYVVSVLFLGYVYAYLLRRNRLKTEFLTRTLSRSVSWTRTWGKTWSKGSENYTRGKLRKRMISLDVSNHHTGTFYLRLGVLGFGIGSMIHSGLNFGTFFSLSGASCNQPLQAIKPMIHLVFTFSQLYFIFMNSKPIYGLLGSRGDVLASIFFLILTNMSDQFVVHDQPLVCLPYMCIHRYKKLARFGLMHMCATNICVWFRSIVVETLHVIHSQDHGGGHTEDTIHLGVASYGGNESNVSDDLCQWSEMMGKAVEAAGPYLYPCTIEYSLMCAGILYVMWKNVGKRPRRPRGSELGDEEDDQRVHRMSVDCTGSSRGLFLGILVMVGTIISIIAFYMLNNREDSKLSGIILTHLSETLIYVVTLIALFMAAYRMKALTFHNQHEADLEDILILISYTGLLLFIIFSLVASILSKPDTKSGLTILSNIVMLIQSTVQTIFMLAGDRISASTEAQERKKPGREFITFLLISNFAMWAINTFETQTPQHNPVQVEFYGPEAWAIFTHISVPLGIYYRFHSTVCFSNIWKNAWKKRKH